jgi:hypothetical protein
MVVTRSGEHGPVSMALTEVTRHNQVDDEVEQHAVALYARWQGQRLKNDGARRGEAVATMVARPNSASEQAAKAEGIRVSEGKRQAAWRLEVLPWPDLWAHTGIRTTSVVDTRQPVGHDLNLNFRNHETCDTFS